MTRLKRKGKPIKLYLLRHAESVGNATNDYSTQIHDSLSESGIKQAEAAAIFLQRLVIDKVCCSPLRRAVQTILPYATAAGKAVEIWPELAEACWQQDRTIRPDDEPRFIPCTGYSDLSPLITFRDGNAVLPAQDETYSQGIHRLRQAVCLLRHHHEKDDINVLVVGHGHANARLLEMFLGIEPIGRFDHVNTGLSCLSICGDEVKVLFCNRRY